MAKEKNNKEEKITEKVIVPLQKKNHSLQNYKAKNHLDDGIKDKPLQWINMSPAYQKVTGLPGIPKGYVVTFRGHSNTGKSTAMGEAVVSAQKNNILPIIIDVENSWSWERAKDLNFEFEEIYGDVVNEETGEIENKVINYEGFFIYVNNEHLLKNHGKLRNKNADEAIVEDVSAFVNKILEDQIKGDLPYELLFAWDSVGVLNCLQGVESKTGNNQFIAGSIEREFRSILNARIPGSRKENKKYTNTFLIINKVWVNNMGMGVLENKGGNAVKYATRIQIRLGSILSASTQKLIATANGKKYTYGTKSKIEVEKNHITSATYSGEIVSTAHGFILPEDIEDYKKQYKDYIASKLDVADVTQLSYIQEDVNDSDISFSD
jgi:hypothetical protein